MRLTRLLPVILAAAALLVAPSGAHAKVFASKEELDKEWQEQVVAPVEQLRGIFRSNRTFSVAEMEAVYGAGPEATYLGVLMNNSPARLSNGLDGIGANARVLANDIPLTRLSNKASAESWANLCDRTVQVVDLIAQRAVPLRKAQLDREYAANPTKDYSEADLAGVLLSDHTWFSEGSGRRYISSPLKLATAMLGDSYWTHDDKYFGHPCTFAWMTAAIASRPNTHADSRNTFAQWNSSQDEYLDFETIPIPELYCTLKNVPSDTCYPSSFYKMYDPPDPAALSNMGLLIGSVQEMLTKMEAAIPAGPTTNANPIRGNTGGSVISLPLPLSNISVAGVIGRVINALLGIVGALALLLFVWGGLTWMTAAGDSSKVDKAKKTITWAALGLLAIFASYTILNLVITAFR